VPARTSFNKAAFKDNINWNQDTKRDYKAAGLARDPNSCNVDQPSGIKNTNQNYKNGNDQN
jgi:hypothetical protein